MQLASAPAKTPTPFAASGTKNAIPVPSQITVTPGAASFTDGFPPLTFKPLSTGGVPPFGADFNGILNILSQGQVWQQAGGQYGYDATFSSGIGGYPLGAVLQRADKNGLWLSTVDSNTSNPDGSGANWAAISANQGMASITMADGTVTPTAVQLANRHLYLGGTVNVSAVLQLPLTAGAMWIVENAVSGAGNGSITIKGPTGYGVVLPAPYGAYLVYTDGANFFSIAAPPTGNYLPIAGNAVSASKWANARTLTVTGVVTGSTSFDGSANFGLNLTMPDNSIAISAVQNLQLTLNGLASQGYVNAQIGAAIFQRSSQLQAAGILVQRGRSTAPASGGYSTSQAVTFPVPFSASPEVILTAMATGNSGPMVCALSGYASTTGFTGVFDVAEGSGASPYVNYPVPFSWIAVGPA